MLIDIRSKDRDIISFKDPEKTHPHPSIGLTSGCFDLFHSLHLSYLQKCRRMCDFLIVGVDCDDFVAKTKGPGRPVIPEHDRVMIINALECVDITFIMGSLDDWERAIYSFFPNYLFKNTNFKPEQVINPLKSEVIIIPDVMKFESTSQIIGQIQKNK